MNLDMIDPNMPLDDIIGALEKHHISKIAFHKKELEKVRSFKFTNNLDGHSNVPSEGFEKNTFFLDGKELEISQKNVKDLVYNFLKKNPQKLWATSDIYENGIMISYDPDTKYRKDWISAISSSLNNLQSSNKVKRFENNSGRGNLYGINDPSIANIQIAMNDFQDLETEE